MGVVAAKPLCWCNAATVYRYLNLDLTAWQIPLPEDGYPALSNENMQCPTVIQDRVRFVPSAGI